MLDMLEARLDHQAGATSESPLRSAFAPRGPITAEDMTPDGGYDGTMIGEAERHTIRATFTHHVGLVEHHEITAEFDSFLVPDEVREHAHAATLDRAEAWADEQGLGIEPRPFTVNNGPGGIIVGTAFDVTVGMGEVDKELDWTWSARWKTWLGTLAAMNIREHTMPPHLTNTDGYEGACANCEAEDE